MSVFSAAFKMCYTYFSTRRCKTRHLPELCVGRVKAASRLVTAPQQRPPLTGTSVVSRPVRPLFTCMDTNCGILYTATFRRNAVMQKETPAKLHSFNPLGPLKGKVCFFFLLWRSYLFAGNYSHLHPSW